ncbi:Abi family protein [Paenarthrobacter sp. NPDC089989]|uniref:Abi family protein n=1 Tax=unclassified Paenarthrobacter TaxID=2634190 RepID=UPI003806A769
MDQQAMMTAFLGEKRLEPFLDAAARDSERASNLYRWNMKLGGSFHTQISYVEVATRNAITKAISDWNEHQPLPQAQGTFGRDWTAPGGLADPLYGQMSHTVRRARKYALQESQNRHPSHPRHKDAPTHDDIVAQLTFGNWTSLFTDRNVPSRREQLWTDALRFAFPNADQSLAGLNKLTYQLETLRRLRNRAAHHENVLAVNVSSRLNMTLSVLRAIDKRFPDWVMAESTLRRIAKEDPRRLW